jgi:hypothetical protein
MWKRSKGSRATSPPCPQCDQAAGVVTITMRTSGAGIAASFYCPTCAGVWHAWKPHEGAQTP